jgi:tetratricopeptide (TPR) repeat protein
MTLKARAVAVFVALCFVNEAHAQIVLGPRPTDPGYGVVGYRFSYRSGGLTVSGFVGGYPAGAYYPAYPPPVYQQPIVVPAPRVTINNNYYGGSGNTPILGAGYAQDTRGVDLDLVPLKKTQPAEPVEPRGKPEEIDAPKPLPGVDVSKPKAPVRPGDPGQEGKPPAKDLGPRPPADFPRPPEPLPDPSDESARLIDLGVMAFQAGEYGHAAQRFRQATEIMPALARGYFFLAQAEFALGSYRDAVDIIHAGMRIDKGWPRMPYQPRLELYKGRDANFADHLKRLTDATAANPNNATLLFLVGHQLWFDGQRKDALALFQRARPLAADRSYIDAFLAVGGPGQLAGP